LKSSAIIPDYDFCFDYSAIISHAPRGCFAKATSAQGTTGLWLGFGVRAIRPLRDAAGTGVNRPYQNYSKAGDGYFSTPDVCTRKHQGEGDKARGWDGILLNHGASTPLDSPEGLLALFTMPIVLPVTSKQ